MADRTPTRRRRPDPVALVSGLAALTLALIALVDGTGWLPPVDPRWILAAGAVTIGVALIAGSLRHRS